MNKKTIFRNLLMLVVLLLCATRASAQEAYACYTPENTTLTFYYDDQRVRRPGKTYDMNTVSNNPGWYTDTNCNNVTEVVFDPSFAAARPTSTSSWFRSMGNLVSITGISNLNTSQVQYMDFMFDSCSSLTSLDLSSFNTSQVVDMGDMFYCCSSLTSLDLSSFDTSKVNNMMWMFYGCSSLTSLDLSSFDTSKVTSMTRMFLGCSNLQTIYVWNSWRTDAVIHSDDMFSRCNNLVGEKGTTYDDSHVDKTYAHVDGGTSNPGYLTKKRDAYASYDPSHKTLTFYYDDKRLWIQGLGETTYDLNQGSDKPGWYTDGTNAEVTRVHFDPSFIDARPKSTYYWFAEMKNLESITNSTYINTSEVKNMESMFQGCRKLTNFDLSSYNTSNVTTMAHMFKDCIELTVLDVSHFDTQNVTDMSYMFSYCYYTKSIDLRGWNTSNVTSMKGMFDNCGWLTSLDVSHFNTSNVTDMSWMFSCCDDLTSLDVSNFNTSNVTDMSSMFWGCSSLESLDLSSFNTEKVTNMPWMFYNCRKLRTIFITNTNDKWSTTAVTDSHQMFYYCEKLVGGKGTAFSYDHITKTYAHIDGGTSNPGYFTEKGTQAYAVYSLTNRRLTFRYDTQRSTYIHGYRVFDVKTDDSYPAWLLDANVSNATSVVFNSAFAAVRPTNTSNWFEGMAQVTSIQGMENLNTRDVTKMDYMFRGCEELGSIDLSHFRTDCVRSMTGMFQGCSSLTELDLGSFYIVTVLVDTRYMFKDCSNLNTIKVDRVVWKTYDVTSSTEMFSGCNNLVGGQGTRYNASNPTDKTYARIDGGTSTPGYLTDKAGEVWAYKAYCVYTEDDRTLTFYYDTQFENRPGQRYVMNMGEITGWRLRDLPTMVWRVVIDPSFADFRPTSTASWFADMYSLQSIEGLEYLNTSEVTDMQAMFYNCGGQRFYMKTFDLSHFNTAKVTNMQQMFGYNSLLTTIIVGDGWTTAAVTNSQSMFYGCTHLVGDQGTAYNADYLDKTYAHIDGGTSNPGYFSHFKEPYACYVAGDKSLTFYYDDQRSSRQGTTYDLNRGNNRPGWTEEYSMVSGIKTVVFNQSFADVLPATTAYWFADMGGLRTITGLENLNTQDVTDMSYMFSNCGIPTLDLSSFNTTLVEDMSYMFYRSRATSIDLSSFNTSYVDTMEGMFQWCFNLTRLDLDNFKTTDVKVMTSMFENCPYLNTICVGTGWTTDAVTASDNMFYGCTRLVGGVGTAYNIGHVDASYAHIDGGPSNPGYFTRFQTYAVYTPENTTLTFYHDSKRDSRTGTTYDMNKGSSNPGWYTDGNCANVTQVVFDSSFAYYCPTTTNSWFRDMTNLQTITDMSYLNTSEVENMGMMFSSCSSLTSLDLSNFNTAKVTAMGALFHQCSSLTSLDLSNFNTANVTSMSSMFAGCRNLQTIYVGDGWNTDAVTYSSRMFNNCTNLKGGKGTVYDANHNDVSYARIDGGTSAPGYFTAFLLGDVNLDGELNAADVTVLVNIILGNPPATYSREAADINGDNNVSIQDLTLLIRMLLP